MKSNIRKKAIYALLQKVKSCEFNAETNSKPCQSSEMELLAEVANGKPVWQGSEYTSVTKHLCWLLEKVTLRVMYVVWCPSDVLSSCTKAENCLGQVFVNSKELFLFYLSLSLFKIAKTRICFLFSSCSVLVFF